MLFATHFHELTDLARERPRVKSLELAVREWGDEVIFLRRVAEQPSSRSYGIEVARLAGCPSRSSAARAKSCTTSSRESSTKPECRESPVIAAPQLPHRRLVCSRRTTTARLTNSARSTLSA